MIPAFNSQSSSDGEIDVSLVIPFYNEAECIESVLTEACLAMEGLSCRYEVIAVDDGSRDETRLKALELKRQCPHLRVLAFDRNRGQAAALLDGLRWAQGRYLVTMDGDGQNDPADIATMLDMLRSNAADMIAGVRAQRKDGWLRRRMSRIANAARHKVLHDGVRDSGCALKAFRKEVRNAFIPIRTLYSFIPALTVAAGFRVTEIEVNHRARETGTSKYGLGVMLWRPLIDMLGVWWFIRRRFQEATPNRSLCAC